MPGGSSEERREAGLPRAEPSSRPQKRALADAEVMAMASPDEDAAAGVVTMGGDSAGSEWRSGDDCITLGDVEALIEQAQHDAEAARDGPICGGWGLPNYIFEFDEGESGEFERCASSLPKYEGCSSESDRRLL